MKYKFSIEIDKHRDEVVGVFLDETKRKEYQEGYVKSELIKGVEYQEGSITRLFFDQKGRKMELVETIVANRLPDSFKAEYHHEHMDNWHMISFEDLGDNRTRYSTEGEYTRIAWVMPRLMSILFPNMFKKPALKWMHNFKNLLERY